MLRAAVGLVSYQGFYVTMPHVPGMYYILS